MELDWCLIEPGLFIKSQEGIIIVVMQITISYNIKSKYAQK